MPRKQKTENVPAKSRILPADYAVMLNDLKARIRTAQVKATLSVNRELIRLYWDIGRAIVERQRVEGWGTSVIERLAQDIQNEFPGIEGFSSSNISRMRLFYLAWSIRDENSAQAVPKIEPESPPLIILEIPWGHNLVILFKLKDPTRRLWYARQAVAHGWSRAVLVHQIESGLYDRQGKAVTNFERALPKRDSDLIRETLKDPYVFDFLTLKTDAEERDLQHGLLAHVRKFLLELGAGFALVGEQVHLEVDGQDFYLDLLFYHLRLRRYVVIELKVGPFKPEYTGKMNFYLSVVDDRYRQKEDKPSIGLILCRTRSQVIAEYALRDMKKPVGVAEYVTKLVESIDRVSYSARQEIEG